MSYGRGDFYGIRVSHIYCNNREQQDIIKNLTDPCRSLKYATSKFNTAPSAVTSYKLGDRKI